MCKGYKLFFLCAAAILACSRENIGTDGEAPGQAKIVNDAENADRQSIIVYVDESVAGTGGVDSIAMASGALACRPLFTSCPGRESEERRFGLDRWYLLTLADGTDIEKTALDLSSESGIQKIQYNTKVKKAAVGRAVTFVPDAETRAVSDAPFNDRYLQYQWHYRNDGSIYSSAVAGADVNAYDAWKLTAGDPSIIVAVLDEGVAYTHPDLAANIWTAADGTHGYNFVKGNSELTWTEKGRVYDDEAKEWYDYEDTGHGTHVAGIIAAVNDNGTGVCGIAGGSGDGGGVKVMSCQIFGCDSGSGTVAVIAGAAKFAADNGASILQCSFGLEGGDVKSDASYKKQYGAEIDAYDYFINSSRDNPINGGICIFAAGNEKMPMAGYPGAMADYVSVTAFGSDYRPAFYTNYGSGCNIAAPGGEYCPDGTGHAIEKTCVLSTMPLELEDDYYDGSGYGYMMGTSMACPHVSGVAALGLSYMKEMGVTCSADEFKAMLLTSVNDIDKYCTGNKRTYDLEFNNVTLDMSAYRGKMGTGAVDAYRLLMQIEGTPCFTAETGRDNSMELETVFGDSWQSLTYKGVEISDEDMANLGLSARPTVSGGRLDIHPTRVGNAKITVNAIAGGSAAGGGLLIGGMNISRTICVMSRGVSGDGWL